MLLEVRGSWYDGNCNTYNFAAHGPYASLGQVTHKNHSILVGAGNGSTVCGGYKFQVRDNTNNQIIYTSTSPAASVYLSYDGSNPPPPEDKYDCINAACIKSTVYDTPGFYASLTECQENCGTGCSGKCISNADWATIEGLAGQHLAKDCGS